MIDKNPESITKSRKLLTDNGLTESTDFFIINSDITDKLQIFNSLEATDKEVVLVEREPSIGGQMARFDKTFPTLDCASCILTPKMVEVGQHPNITLMTYSEVEEFSGVPGQYHVQQQR